MSNRNGSSYRVSETGERMPNFREEKGDTSTSTRNDRTEKLDIGKYPKPIVFPKCVKSGSVAESGHHRRGGVESRSGATSRESGRANCSRRRHDWS
jgi:hypothetical protein